jgi:hypothetical protein
MRKQILRVCLSIHPGCNPCLQNGFSAIESIKSKSPKDISSSHLAYQSETDFMKRRFVSSGKQVAHSDHSGKGFEPMTIAIVGLGYVGVPLGLQFARSGVRVIGIDNETSKIETLARGESYIKHLRAGEIRIQIKRHCVLVR